MACFTSPIVCSLLLALFPKLVSTQPVVNVKTSNYPNNILQVPVYARFGSIKIELSETVLNTTVRVSCQTLSSNSEVSNVVFQDVDIPIGGQNPSIPFDIVAAGRVAEVQCSAESINGGTQFQNTSSIGKNGYILITRRPTVSLCSDVVVVPMDLTIINTVEILLSEPVVNDPVEVNCAVISPLKAGTAPMKLIFNASSVQVSSTRANISYVLGNEGGAVIVGCWASSNSTTTTPDRLQYTKNTSQGETAVFVFKVSQATFVPAKITSLGRTTVARTVSYLVLEKRPVSDVVEFRCTIHNTSFANDASMCSPSLGITSSLDLASVTVELTTTNVTFKIGEYYKPIMVQVNGSSTTRDQRLLGVTCCRKNADPRYFVLATTLSLWIDLYPSVQFSWNNVTDNEQATTYSQFDSHCFCDLQLSLCDVGCCCDEDCSSTEKKVFSCIPGYFMGSTRPAIFEYGCQETWRNGDNHLALLCVVTDNSPLLGLLYDTPPASAGDNVQFDALQAGAHDFEYRENETRSLEENDVTGSGYRAGVIVKTDRAFLSLPQEIGTGDCARYAPVSFLKDSIAWCSSEFSETTCSERSSWNALEYLVPRTTFEITSCFSSPQVLNVNDRANSSLVPTHVAYFCVEDSSSYTTLVGRAWNSPERAESRFDGEGSGNENRRCLFDDDVSSPPAPAFNASSRKCSNVVLRVNYEIYWTGSKIVQIRAKVTLGDISAPASTLTVTQRFSVKFIHLQDVDLTKLPFIRPVVEERSGNPGYIRGKKVIAKTVKGQSGTSIVTTEGTSVGQLGLWSSSSTGLCKGAETSDVLFGINSLTGCLLRLTLKDFANCSLLREAVLRNQRNIVKATHVARRGNVTKLNETDDWLLLLSEIPLESTNVDINQSQPVNGSIHQSNSSNASNSQSQWSCDDVPSGLHYEILVKETGKNFGVVQMEIVGARVRYSTHSWRFQCINGQCNICNGTSSNATNTNDTTQCSDSVQSFAVTSSVTFVALSGRDDARKKRSQDAVHICYQDSCVQEVFYPLLTSYDGESRETTVAYGLMLIAFVLLFTSSSPLLLRNLKTMLIG